MAACRFRSSAAGGRADERMEYEAQTLKPRLIGYDGLINQLTLRANFWRFG